MSETDETSGLRELSRILPEKPEKPLDSDCCGSGCVPCVLDIYAEELAIWEQECARIKAGETSYSRSDSTVDAESPALSLTDYHRYQIESIIQETHNTWRYRCRLGRNQSLGLSPGQHVVIRGHLSDKAITRQYTPVSYVSCKGFFELLIKVYEDGRMSQVVKTWQVGDWLEVRGPFGTLQYLPNKYDRIIMLAAGTGIAPMAQLIQSILANEEEEGKVRLVYACRCYEEVLMRKEIAEWRRFWNFSAVFAISQQQDANSSLHQYGEEIILGRISQDMLVKELGENWEGTRILICGTRSFDAEMQQMLRTLGFPEHRVFKF
ncbi:hypothetical protein BaRGS_00006593 [Batillaria attramentaria]|uniref:NADH-cytochrome b5 reductase n=1 Tax=Batillaria attramentaria TaxID=370345 RepID=A0ABD0LRP9_9CAEN